MTLGTKYKFDTLVSCLYGQNTDFLGDKVKITPTSLTISQLFSSKNEQFFIPAYQRRYSWGLKQLRDLFDDIGFLKGNDNHLLGSIVCLTESHVVGVNTLELVDGQQRITSLSILMKAIRNMFTEMNNAENISEINGYLSCKGIDGKFKNKLLLGDLDNPDYIKLMEGENVDLIRNENMLNTYNWFIKWLEEYDVNKLSQFYFRLINNVHVIRLDVGQAKDAYKLFETINNRGLSLSPTDIIKNFILGHASIVGEDTLIKVKNNWKELIVNLDGIDIDDFFRQYMCGIHRRKVTEFYLIDTFKKHYIGMVEESDKLSEYSHYNDVELDDSATIEETLEEENIKDELKQESDEQLFENSEPTSKDIKKEKITIIEFSSVLKEAATTYSKILSRGFDDKKINQHLFNLQRIKSFPAYIFLLNIFQRKLSNDIMRNVLILLETFMLRRHVCEYRTGELDDIFSKLVDVKNENMLEKVKENLSKHLPRDDDFEQKFSNHDYKGKANRAKYVLEMLEYDLIEDKGEYTLNTGTDLHLEHIIPQTITSKKSKKFFGDWIGYLGKNAENLHPEYVNKIGNFTLLAQELNIVASNNPFESKLKEYNKSNIALTKVIVQEYNEFKFSEVEQRSEFFAKKASSLWKF